MEHFKSSDDQQTSTVIQQNNSLQNSKKNLKRNYRLIYKNVYLIPKVKRHISNYMSCDCKLTDDQLAQGIKGCGIGCLNRMVKIECGNDCSLKEQCTNKRFQNREFSKFQVVQTINKGLGLISSEDIPEGTFICEYIGEVINSEQLNNRRKNYANQEIPHVYFMGLESGTYIDAMLKGNESRFVNHSCDPNAAAQKWEVNRVIRIGYFSIRQIRNGEEITIDYQFDNRGYGQKCYCESTNCRGWIGGKPDDSKIKDKKDSEYVVKKVLDRKNSKHKIEYLVKSKGFNNSQNSWVSEKNMNCELTTLLKNALLKKKANTKQTRKSKRRTVESDLEKPKEKLRKTHEFENPKRCPSLCESVSSQGCKGKSDESNITDTTDSEYEVEKVLDRRNSKNDVEYLVKWKGFDSSGNSWVPKKRMNCVELITLYEKTLLRKKANTEETRKKSKTRTIKSNLKNRRRKSITRSVNSNLKKLKEQLRKSHELGNPKRCPSLCESISSQGCKGKSDESNITDTTESEYEIEKVLDRRNSRNKIEYLVKWKGFDSSENSWVPKKRMNCVELITLYEKTLLRKKANTEETRKKSKTRTIKSNLKNRRRKSITRTVNSNLKKLKEQLRKFHEIKNPKRFPSPCEIVTSQGSEEKLEESEISWDENTEFTVEEILDRRNNGDNVEYLLKWKDYDNCCSWVLDKNLNCPDLITSYEAKLAPTIANAEETFIRPKQDTKTVESNLEPSEEITKMSDNMSKNSKKCACELFNIQGCKGKPDSISYDKNLKYMIEEILDMKMTRNTAQYLIKWKGYDKCYNTWLSENYLNGLDLINRCQFVRSRKNAQTEKTVEKQQYVSKAVKVNLEKSKTAVEKLPNVELRDSKKCSCNLLFNNVQGCKGKPDSILYDENMKNMVQAILDLKYTRNSALYLIKWKGFDKCSNAWVPEVYLKGLDMIPPRELMPWKYGKKNEIHSKRQSEARTVVNLENSKAIRHNKELENSKMYQYDSDNIQGCKEIPTENLLNINLIQCLIKWRGDQKLDNSYNTLVPQNFLNGLDFISSLPRKNASTEETRTQDSKTVESNSEKQEEKVKKSRIIEVYKKINGAHNLYITQRVCNS